ncbi:uncharacterized protein TRIVIDRAFT_198808 [Trichoderma virens Gv29-8]|uniref:Transcription factor domain-containing protein n=1 Tax=Hypocrea virens (strain Gv29-8 / FGSC 10586) TaxID=413071 RepID=G9MK72_HYPVG|nr:uncharacterized protein TRIVIDRAFT_198808 [Trichoderma virens Gv29-8]EHK25877.1 hypothetical protein TRIVIDRAFT_198808 [Trichoderma virens Gv29-8]UKZ48301.1 hypothetical protein TrVGV298_002524 [Trichoderma virens]
MAAASANSVISGVMRQNRTVHGRDCHYDGAGVLPIPMPFESMQLLHHATHFRLLTTTVVAKNPNSSLAGLVMQNAATFRSFLLIAGIHHVWSGGSLESIEETMLHHKLEAIRVVNGMISDPLLCRSDACITSIVGLAMVEAALGDAKAAEAHLKALAGLFDERRLDQDKYRLFGLVERLILLAASLVAASKDKKESDPHYFVVEPAQDSEPRHHYTRPTGPVFSAVPFLSIHLSPFYHSTPPDIEACNADAECEIIATTLRRLSSPFQRQNPESSHEEYASSASPKEQARKILRADAESYIGSLLFKPCMPAPNDSDRSQDMTSGSRSPDSQRGPDENEDMGSHFVNFSGQPFVNLPSAIFPSTSRAWACAAYLYLHMIVDCMPRRGTADTTVKMDTHLQRWLINTLRQDLEHTEEAMRIGAHSSELWLWKTILGAYALSKSPIEMPVDVEASDEDDDEKLARFANQMAFDKEPQESGGSNQSLFPSGRASLQWFAGKTKAWSSVTHVISWEGAKTALGRIAWPENFGDDQTLSVLWEEAIGSADI